jgi:dephospho-CoA kinase
MKLIGITGGIGTGKTIVCRLFELMGVPVYDSDYRAKWVMANNQTLRQELIGAFGKQIFTAAGELDRTNLAQLVFNDTEKLKLLNSLVHPHVRADFADWAAAYANRPYVLKEAALMYESEAWKQMDKIIVIAAPLDLRIRRIQQRDPHRSLQHIQAIIDKQLHDDEKLSRADYIICNNDKQPVIPQVLLLHQKLLQLAEDQPF